MNHKQLLKDFSKLGFVRKANNQITNSTENFGIRTLYGSAKSLFVAALLANNPDAKFILLAPNTDTYHAYTDDLNAIAGEDKINSLDNNTINLSFKVFAISKNAGKSLRLQSTYIAELLDNLTKWTQKGGLAIIMPEVFETVIPTLANVKQHFCNLKQKQVLDIYQFTTQLALNGFQKEQYVSRAGEFAVRGGIVDIFAPNMPNPFRIELWGNEIDSIRVFDTLSQRSIGELTEIDFIDSLFVENENTANSSIWDNIPNETIFIIDTPEAFDWDSEHLKPIAKYRQININPLGNPPKDLSDNAQVAQHLRADGDATHPVPQRDNSPRLIEVHCTPQPKMHSSIQHFALATQKWLDLKINVFVSADGDVLLNRFKDLLESLEEDDVAFPLEAPSFPRRRESPTMSDEGEWTESHISHDRGFPPAREWQDSDSGMTEKMDAREEQASLLNVKKVLDNVNWNNTVLSSGFCLLEDRLIYMAEHEIFSRARNSKSNKVNAAKGISLRELKQLNIGDFIVHEDKGVGKFAGFQTIDMGGSKQDCLKMLFQDNDVLYVHLNYLHKVQKYSAAEGVVPRLSKLGSTEWLRKKNRTKSKLKDIARDLILLYAQRKMQKGYAFPVDTTWQKEFEASFIYEDTIDQARTTLEVKKDMEADTPMDRLVCGDVGFGKTEIAIRAAFKAATAGKQTAVLVPTTILAEQHYQTFRERINRYPVSVDTLSRFRSKQQQKNILEHLKENRLDIIIGTHRLLSKDVEFKNLGLLIIDEEHRFGVGAKEKLRQLKANIDTLTLTATPIPRTLNFSLMGARDLSQMETPPRNRLPVETDINEKSIENISKYILNEVKRKGQVFIVNDKIQGLENLLSDLQAELPSVRFGLIHGQMQPAKIEDIMEKFIEKKYDVLLATKIIESGIDIPNANTIIINNAHHFGLAELYQLRGRVGRSNIQAYCYLLIPSFKLLPDKALRRLLAIEEFTDLGSGLQLALRDLEIRGSGDLLGAEQSGFISEIGFELYQKVLEEAVDELKTDEFADIFQDKAKSELPKFNNDDINIETEGDAFFPDDYISDDTERFNYYKRLFDTQTNKELNDTVVELEDRYGKLPQEAEELIFVVRLRVAALNTGFTRIKLKTAELIIDFPPAENKVYYEKVFPIVLDIIRTFEDIELSQSKEKLQARMPLIVGESASSAIDFLWKIKKTIEASF